MNRYFRYCNENTHTEDALHLIRCADIQDEEKNKIIKQLRNDKRLVFTHGWFLLGSGVFCNPRYYSQECFFTQREDCIKYMQLNFDSVSFSLRICKSEENYW